MTKSKYDIPRHILLNYEQDQWAELEADRLGLSTGAYFRTLLEDDKARKQSKGLYRQLSPYDRAERRYESIQKPIQNNDNDIALAIAIANAIKASRAG